MIVIDSLQEHAYIGNGEYSPSITAACGMGGGQTPMIVEPQVLCNKRTEYGKAIRKDYESHKVYEKRGNMVQQEPRTDGICNAITTLTKDNMILEPMIVASRGRNPKNSSDRTPGCPTEQRLELNTTGCSNCITSVEKDNYVLEPNKRIN